MNIVNQCKPGCQRKARRCPKQRSNATSDLNLTDMNSPVSSKSSHIEVILCNSYLIFFTRQILPYLQTINVWWTQKMLGMNGGAECLTKLWKIAKRAARAALSRSSYEANAPENQSTEPSAALEVALLAWTLHDTLETALFVRLSRAWSGLWWMLTIPAHGVFLKIWAQDIVSEGWCVHVHTLLSSFASNTNTDFLLLRSFKIFQVQSQQHARHHCVSTHYTLTMRCLAPLLLEGLGQSLLRDRTTSVQAGNLSNDKNSQHISSPDITRCKRV